MKKNFILSLALGFALLIISAISVQAATPTLSLSGLDSDSVQVTVNGDADANVLLFFYRTDGGTRLQYLGKTNNSGYFSQSVSSSNYNIMAESSVYVTVNNQMSEQKNWPITNSNGTGGALSLAQTGVVMKVNDSLNVNVYNAGSQSLYLLNNSNPQVANVNISSNTQLNIKANAYGQTVVTVCVLGTTSNCASVYVTVQNANAQALTFSQSNLTVAHNQNTNVSILSGTGSYTIVNNSNPSIIQASLNNEVITLTANNNTGTAALTVCRTDMSACGIINASAGTTSSTSLTFNQENPVVYVGQSQSIAISGGSNYNVSSNSNNNILSANISSSNLVLTGSQPGSSTVTVCASNGNCASITATVSYSSTGGALTLSQSNLWLQAGQAISVVISGGSMPYNLGILSNSSLVSTSLNNNILTLTGLSAGSGTLDVCSAGGACQILSFLVQGTATNSQLSFSNNNLSLATGSETKVNIFGAGSYYVSSSHNQHVATVSVTNNQASVKALSAGNANATICQSDGQCSILYISVTSINQNNPPAFSVVNPEISLGQSLNIVLSGSDSNTYFLSSNSNPAVAQASVSGSNLSVNALSLGNSVLSVCSATNNCSSLSVKVVSVSNSSNNQTPTSNDRILEIIALESSYVAPGNADVIAGNAKVARNESQELATYTKYVVPLTKNFSLSAQAANALTYFIHYGTPATLRLGAGERAGVLSSYWQAYKKLPQTEADWSDVVKISLGRWPSEINANTEDQAKAEFRKVYKREAVMSNNKDENAITIIAYGLRPINRNTASEQAAITTFRSVYDHNPVNPLAWNIVRAIAYSGATR